MPVLKSKVDPDQAELSRIDAAVKANSAESLRLRSERAAVHARVMAKRYTAEQTAREVAEAKRADERALELARRDKSQTRAGRQELLIEQLEADLAERKKRLPESLLTAQVERLREERHNLDLIKSGAAL